MNITYKNWTKDEEFQVKDLYCVKGLGSVEIAKILNRPVSSIWNKIKRRKFRHTKDQEKNLRSRNNIGENNGMYGKIGPNRGLTTKNCERVKNAGIKISKTISDQFDSGERKGLNGKANGMYGKPSWCRGQTKENNIKILLSSQKSVATKKKNWDLLPEEEKDIVRKRWAMFGLKCKKKNTLIEQKTAKFLDCLNVKYIQNHPINRFLIDFYLPDYNLAIECNGDYWHCNPNVLKFKDPDKIQLRNIDRDKRKGEILKNKNIPLLILWEAEIHSGISEQQIMSVVFKRIPK
jgi:G:T-mismatch repair DNA endonuclease (very short patch repair protein)